MILFFELLLYLLLLFILKSFSNLFFAYTWIPFLYAPFLIMYILKRNEKWGFTFAFLAGLLRGLEIERDFGRTSLFFLLTVYLLYLIRDKIDLRNLLVRMVLLILFTLVNLILLRFPFFVILTKTVSTAACGLVIFYVGEKIQQIF
ncbi:MAG TPA: hypothetical protein VJC03_09395 [bacterium]|nr:hypothetical protein [bacterium]